MLKVGTSRVDITPPVGMPHANWGSSVHQVAEGIDMPMYCNVMYLESESSKNKVVILDFDLCSICLLYTSPSPRDRTRSRMPSSA